MKMVCPSPGCGFIYIETREELERSRFRLRFLPMSLPE
jgi:hypothetical protein